MFSVFCCLLKVLRSRKLFCLGCSLVVGSSANGSVSASGRSSSLCLLVHSGRVGSLSSSKVVVSLRSCYSLLL